MNTTIEVICYKYKSLKNNKLPLKLRITKNRKRKYISIGISVESSHWDFVKNQPKPNCPNRTYIEKIISSKINEYREKVLELNSENKEFTAYSLAEKDTKAKTTTVKVLFEEHVENLRMQKRYGYAASVELLYNSMLKFNKHLNILFSEIDNLWLKKYEMWLRKSGVSENTLGIRFRTLRMMYNLAIEEGIVKSIHYPFTKYKVSKLHEETAKRSISKKDIISIINYPKTGKYYKSFAVDIFTFSYLMGGINFADIAYLTRDNIIDGVIVYSRRKTSKLISLPLHEKALDIIERYQNAENDYLFPILSSFHQSDQQKINRIHKVISKVNRDLKQIGKELKIPIKLTTYVARHSFSTVLKKSGVATSIISESLGHSSEKVTRIYLANFDKEHIEEAMQNLLD